MNRSFGGAEHTPPELFEVVRFIRTTFEGRAFSTNFSTKHLCHAKLHPGVRVAGQISGAFNNLSNFAESDEISRFRHLIEIGTEPAIFAAFLGIRRHLFERYVLQAFQELISVATVQSDLLDESPSLWTHSRVSHLISRYSGITGDWVREVCDVPPPQSGGVEEIDQRREWRAPMFVAMTYPSYDNRQGVWERCDEASTSKLLDGFEQEFYLRLQNLLREATALAQLEELERTPIAGPEKFDCRFVRPRV